MPSTCHLSDVGLYREDGCQRKPKRRVKGSEELTMVKCPCRFSRKRICYIFSAIIFLYFFHMMGFLPWKSEDHVQAMPSFPTQQNPTTNEMQRFHTFQPRITTAFSVAVGHKYYKVGHFDLKDNNMGCDKDGKCSIFRVRNVAQAMALCETYGDTCQGFVLEEKTGLLYIKINVVGETVRDPNLQFYVKKTFLENLEQRQCAVAVESFREASAGCVLPVLDPFNKHIMKFMDKNIDKTRCPGKRYTTYENGVLSITEQDNSVNAIKVQGITRKPHSDWGFILTDKQFEYSREKSLKMDEEFLRVDIDTSKKERVVEFHAEVAAKPEVLQRKLRKGGLDVNVLMIGFDSTSSAQMQRALPEVYRYLKDELNSHIFQGYSIVGDGTTPQLTAMLTGYTEAELPEARRGFKNSSTIDTWPWIFKEYHRYGYATMYSEDDSPVNAFNYRLHGFKDPPADHYSRTFWQAAPTLDNCIEAIPQSQLHFSYIKSFMRAYKEVPKLGLAFLSSISHGNINSLRAAKEYILDFFKSINEKGFLGDTILMVFSDHGMRYGDARATMQSKLEERLPFLSITLPKAIRKKFPELDSILKENTKKLTSPFDVHATLRHILSYSTVQANSRKPGTSLFGKIADDRGCTACGIPEHYCPCVQLKEVSVTHLHVQKAAVGLVGKINGILNADPLSAEKCSNLKLGEIKSAHQNLNHPKVTKFSGSKDVDGRIPMFVDHAKDDECKYQLLIRTVPGDALFEATVQVLNGKLHFERDVSRINKYGDQPKCIAEERPYMRKFCFCKGQN